MKKNTVLVGAVSFMLGAALFGGGTAYAAGIFAERNASPVYIDGQLVTLDAYTIEGQNYVKLRDIGQAIGVNVYWNGAVQIDTHAPYTGEAPADTRKEMIDTPAAGDTDFSAAANPEIFTGAYTREAYNAVYTVLAALRAGDETAAATIHIDNQEDRWKLEQALAGLSNGYTLSLRGVENGVYEVYVVKPDREIANQYTADFVREVNALPTDREKVIAINDYLCDKVIYDPDKYAGLNDIASAASPIYGNCASFAAAMNELCAKAAVPCIKVHGEHHFWNSIYCDGVWSYTDASLNDQTAARNRMLFSDTARKQIEDMEGVRFIQELLIPGSTK